MGELVLDAPEIVLNTRWIVRIKRGDRYKDRITLAKTEVLKGVKYERV
jgi:hypothetical protein